MLARGSKDRLGLELGLISCGYITGLRRLPHQSPDFAVGVRPTPQLRYRDEVTWGTMNLGQNEDPWIKECDACSRGLPTEPAE